MSLETVVSFTSRPATFAVIDIENELLIDEISNSCGRNESRTNM